jgi:hypothetical protein
MLHAFVSAHNKYQARSCSSGPSMYYMYAPNIVEWYVMLSWTALSTCAVWVASTTVHRPTWFETTEIHRIPIPGSRAFFSIPGLGGSNPGIENIIHFYVIIRVSTLLCMNVSLYKGIHINDIIYSLNSRAYDSTCVTRCVDCNPCHSAYVSARCSNQTVSVTGC